MCLYNVSTVRRKNDFLTVGDKDACLTRDFNGDGKATRSVVEDEVHLLVGRDDQAGRRKRQRPRHLNEHITGYTRSAVGDRDRGIGTRSVCNGLRHIPGDRLLNQRSEVGVGRRTPSTGLFTCADKFNRKVRAVRGCYDILLGPTCLLPDKSRLMWLGHTPNSFAAATCVFPDLTKSTTCCK